MDAGQCCPVVCESCMSSDCGESNPWDQALHATVEGQPVLYYAICLYCQYAMHINIGFYVS